jgi:ATP-dependent Lon protease
VTEAPIPTGAAAGGGEVVLPALLLPTVVVFPGLFGPLEVTGLEVAAVEAAAAESLPLALFWQDPGEGPPSPERAPALGVSARVVRFVRMPTGDVRLLLQGTARVRRLDVVATQPVLRVRVRVLEPTRASLEGSPLREAVLNSLRAVAAPSPAVSDEAAVAAANQTDAGEMADVVAGVLELSAEDRQTVLETLDPVARLELVLRLCERRRSLLEVAQQIQRQATERAGEQQREYLLREDGPSAGVTLTTALVSAATGRPVNRCWAMTGEITLRGLVLPVGGIKEKVLAADRAGLDGVLLPRGSERDLVDVPAEVRERRRLELVDSIDQVLDRVLAPAGDRVLEMAPR